MSKPVYYKKHKCKICKSPATKLNDYCNDCACCMLGFIENFDPPLHDDAEKYTRKLIKELSDG